MPHLDSITIFNKIEILFASHVEHFSGKSITQVNELNSTQILLHVAKYISIQNLPRPYCYNVK